MKTILIAENIDRNRTYTLSQNMIDSWCTHECKNVNPNDKYWGHYHRTFSEAFHEFLDRCGITEDNDTVLIKTVEVWNENIDDWKNDKYTKVK